MTYPNLFIVGAPKCATTALARYLGNHPAVGAMPKEVHCFGSDLDIRKPGGLMSLDEYQRRAAELGKSRDVVIDASVFYLSSEKAAAEIHAFNPEARIIIMLRKPADMIRSLHQQELQNRDEALTSLGDALDAEYDRRQGRNIPSTAINICGLFYRHIASYADQVQRFQDRFPKSQIKVILYDDLRADTRAVYQEACRFVGIEPDPHVNLDPVNTAASVRFAPLVELQRRVLYRFEIYRKAGKILPKAIRAPLWKAWQGLLYREGKVELGDPAILPMLTAEFAGDVARLEKLIDRDLSAWKV